MGSSSPPAEIGGTPDLARQTGCTPQAGGAQCQQESGLTGPQEPSPCAEHLQSLVPADSLQPGHARRLSDTLSVSQQQLSDDIRRDVLEGLPLRSSGVSHDHGPQLRVQRVDGDSHAVDITVVHSFRAHFDQALPASPETASPARLAILPAGGVAAAGRATEAAGGAAGAAAAAGEGLPRPGSSLRVEELSQHSSSSTESMHSGKEAAAAGARRGGSAAAGAPAVACRVEMPESPHCSSASSSRSAAFGGGKASAAAGPSAAGVQAPDGDSPVMAMPTPSAAEPAPRPASAPDLSGSGSSSGGSGGGGMQHASSPAAAPALLAGVLQQAGSPTLPAQAQHGPSTPAAGPAQAPQQLQPAPVAPPAAWEPSWLARAEVQRRFQDFQEQQQSFGGRVLAGGPAGAAAGAAAGQGQQPQAGPLPGQRQPQQQVQQQQQGPRQDMERADSLMSFEINPHDLMVGERLAVGGFAEVFSGRYQGTAVAIKLLLSVDERGQESFRQEVHTLERLRHPNVVLFMGICTRPYLAIVSEFMARGSLFQLLRRGGNRPLPPKLQRSVAISVARGMAYLHSRSPPLMHLDLKSPNILLDDRWRVKIADFGLSRLKKANGSAAGTGAGTPEWMAPEILRLEPYDERADVYSYGVLLWECLTGRQPWEGLHPMQVVGAVGFQGKQLPMEGMQGDPLLTELCRRCLSMDPRQRPTFSEILGELERAYSLRARAGSAASSLGSPVPADPSLPSSAAGAGHPADQPALPALPFPVAQPALRLPARVVRNSAPRAGSGGAATAAGIPGHDSLGMRYSDADGGGEEGGEGDSGGGSHRPYGGHESSPFAPSGPVPTAGPPSGPPSGTRSGLIDASTSPPAAPAGPLAALHPAASLTNDSPFAQLPPFDDGGEDAAAGGGERGSSEGCGPPALSQIAESSIAGGSRASRRLSSSSSGYGARAGQLDAAAEAAAAELATELRGCQLVQSSEEGSLMGGHRLSSGSLVRGPSSSQLLSLADAVAAGHTSSLGPGSGLAKQRSAGDLQPGGGHPTTGNSSCSPATARTVATPFQPPSVGSVSSAGLLDPAAWHSLDTSGL